MLNIVAHFVEDLSLNNTKMISCSLKNYIYLFIIRDTCVEIRGQLVRVGSLLPPHGAFADTSYLRLSP